jgi:hypothetical protein
MPDGNTFGNISVTNISWMYLEGAQASTAQASTGDGLFISVRYVLDNGPHVPRGGRTEHSPDRRATGVALGIPGRAASAPPVTTRPDRLPLSELSWKDAERFSFAFSRNRAKCNGRNFLAPRVKTEDVAAEDPPRRPQVRPYAVLQGRRVETLYPSGIRSAVDDFLAGSWPDNTGTFYYATSFDLTDTRLDSALRESADRLAELGIQLVPWGVVEVSELLRPIPRLVDDFFGRAWVEYFCGPSAAESLGPRMTFTEVRDLRVRLSGLYAAVFDSQVAVRTPPENASPSAPVGDPGVDRQFTMLDVAPNSSTTIGDLPFVANDFTGVEISGSSRSSLPGFAGTARDCARPSVLTLSYRSVNAYPVAVSGGDWIPHAERAKELVAGLMQHSGSIAYITVVF